MNEDSENKKSWAEKLGLLPPSGKKSPEQWKQYAEKLGSNFIIAVIIINAVILGIQTIPGLTENQIDVLDKIDKICLLIFTIEIIVRIIEHCFEEKSKNKNKNIFFIFCSFFKSGWNIFDFVIVLVSIITEAAFFSSFRTVRVGRLAKNIRLMKQVSQTAKVARETAKGARLLKITASLKEFQRITDAIILSIPGLSWALALLSVLMYVYAIIGINLFRSDMPEMFGDLQSTFFTLFQIMTFDSWASGIVRPLLDTHPFAWVYFISFVLLSAQIILNMIIGIINESVQQATKNCKKDKTNNNEEADLKTEFSKLKEQIEKIENLLNKEGKL